MNEDVLQMIDTLHARLDDVREVAEGLACEAPGYAKRLDGIDDALYLLQCDLEALGHGEEPAGEGASAAAPAATAEGGEAKKDDKKDELISDEMKENLVDAGRALGNIYRDGKEVVTELTGAMGDIKDVFSFGKKR